jgi:spore germination protein GerM
MIRVFVGILLSLVLAGCNEGLHIIPRDELPADLYGPPSPAAPSMRPTTTKIYLTRDGHLVAVTRAEAVAEDRLESALRMLLRGPTDQEAAGGLGTAIPLDAGWIDGSVSSSIASINLSSGFELGAEQSILALRVAQVVFTATEVPGVSKVRLLIDGEPIDVVTDDGETRGGPVGRADYASLSPP